jgi:hypothetical protein
MFEHNQIHTGFLIIHVSVPSLSQDIAVILSQVMIGFAPVALRDVVCVYIVYDELMQSMVSKSDPL